MASAVEELRSALCGAGARSSALLVAWAAGDEKRRLKGGLFSQVFIGGVSPNSVSTLWGSYGRSKDW